MMAGIRRNQSKWHTLKLSCMFTVSKTPNMHICIILTAITAMCLLLTRSYLATILLNALITAVYSTLKRAEYTATLSKSLMCSVCLLLFFPMSRQFILYLMIFNYITVASIEPCRRLKSSVEIAYLKSVISCLCIAYIQTRIPNDASLFIKGAPSLFPWYITYPGGLTFLYFGLRDEG